MYWTTLLLATVYAALVFMVLFSVQKRVFRSPNVKFAAKASGRLR